MKDIRKIIDTFSNLTTKLWFAKEDLVTVNESTTMCILAKDSAELFKEEFGTYNSRQFLNALTLFEECELEFKDPYVIIKDAKNKSKRFKYKMADIDAMERTIERNSSAIKLLNDLKNDLETLPFIKINISDEYIKKMKDIIKTYKLSIIEFNYTADNDNVNLVINENKGSAEWNDAIKIEEKNGKMDDFKVTINAQYLIDNNWDVYFIEGKRLIYFENDNFKMAIVHDE